MDVFLKCKVRDGMFPNEKAIELELDDYGNVSFFMDMESCLKHICLFTPFELFGDTTYFKTKLLDRTEEEVLVELPKESLCGHRLLKVKRLKCRIV